MTEASPAPRQTWRPLPRQFLRSGAVHRTPAAARPRGGTVEELAAWLTGPARNLEPVAMFDEFAWRLDAAGVPIRRATLHVGTLHPQFLGFSMRWQRDEGETQELMISHEMRDAQAFQVSPIRLATVDGIATRRRLDGPPEHDDFPVLADLRALGATEYLALPLPGSNGRFFAVTFATDQPQGFDDRALAAFERLAEPLSLVVDLMSQRRIAFNLLSAYLGPQSGAKVLAGEVRRGTGEAMRAVIWSSDIRGFTERSDRLPGERMIAILNACFDAQAEAVVRHGGEILKFMGDGLLAIFPLADVGFSAYAARNALEAAQEAQAAVARLAGTELLAGEPPLRIVVALHVGQVHYGNIGAADRLDFTVIGPAVNFASRVETVAKALDQPIVVSDAFRAAYAQPLRPLGAHALRGLPGTHQLYAP